MSQPKQKPSPNRRSSTQGPIPWHLLLWPGLWLLFAMLSAGAGLFYLVFARVQAAFTPGPLVWRLFGGGLLLVGLLIAWLALRLLKLQLAPVMEREAANFNANDAQQPAGPAQDNQLFEQTQLALKETAALYRVTRSLAQLDNEQEMFEMLLAEYLQYLNLQQGGVLILDEDKAYGTLQAHMIAGRLVEPGLRIMVTGNPFFDQLIANKEPVVIKNALDDRLSKAIRDSNQALGIKSLLLVPVIVRNEVIGALGADATADAYEFTEREISFVKAIADQLGIAVENARLHAETKRRALQLAVLHELDRAIANNMGLNEIYALFAHHVIKLLSYDHLAITLLAGNDMRVAYMIDLQRNNNVLPAGTRLPLKSSATGQVVRQGQPMLRHTIDADSHYDEDKLLAARGIQSTLIIPLRVKGEVFGTWNIGSEQANAYNPEDLQMAQTMAEQLAIAIENTRLYHEIHQYLEELTTLNMISQIITSTLDLQEMLAIITTHTRQLLDVEATSVALYDEVNDDLWFAAASGDSADFVREKRLPVGEGIIGWVARHGEPVLVPDASKDPRIFSEFDHESGFKTRSILCVPLETKGQTIGAIEAINKEGSFDEDDLRLLSSLAASAAAAIENARLFEQAQQEIAERVRAEEALQDTIQRLEMSNKQVMIYAQELKEEIIERKRAEAALQEERTLLAQRVAERTADLSAANEELARAARLKDEFLASMSHELRTPLSAILGLTEVLRGEIYGPLNEKQLKSLGSIEESGRHLLALINDILDLSKIGAGKLELQIGTVPVARICEASLRLVKQAAHKKQITISSTVDDLVTILQADERRLKQILVNLLSNAVKFTPEGGAIGLEVEGDVERQEVHFTIWDTGIGIAEEDMDRLFQPFVQLDSRLSRQFPGTGLGLALVHRMVELHHGYVSVESKIGQGSRFTVSLPWLGAPKKVEAVDNPKQPDGLADPNPSDSRQKPLPTDNTSASPSTKSALVLLVEDDEGMATFMENYLAANGYQVMIAQNGIQAIDQARKAKPDIILMDVQMPEMDGLEATRYIRGDTDQQVATIPIIALTALAMSGDRERCLEAGANDYLSKPLKLKELIEAIDAQLYKNQLAEKGLPS